METVRRNPPSPSVQQSFVLGRSRERGAKFGGGVLQEAGERRQSSWREHKWGTGNCWRLFACPPARFPAATYSGERGQYPIRSDKRIFGVGTHTCFELGQEAVDSLSAAGRKLKKNRKETCLSIFGGEGCRAVLLYLFHTSPGQKHLTSLHWGSSTSHVPRWLLVPLRSQASALRVRANCSARWQRSARRTVYSWVLSN